MFSVALSSVMFPSAPIWISLVDTVALSEMFSVAFLCIATLIKLSTVSAVFGPVMFTMPSAWYPISRASDSTFAWFVMLSVPCE